jgi:hypothetical protein
MPWRKSIKTSDHCHFSGSSCDPSFPVGALLNKPFYLYAHPSLSMNLNFGSARQEPRMPTRSLPKHLSHQGWVEAFGPTQISPSDIWGSSPSHSPLGWALLFPSGAQLFQVVLLESGACRPVFLNYLFCSARGFTRNRKCCTTKLSV